MLNVWFGQNDFQFKKSGYLLTNGINNTKNDRLNTVLNSKLFSLIGDIFLICHTPGFVSLHPRLITFCPDGAGGISRAHTTDLMIQTAGSYFTNRHLLFKNKTIHKKYLTKTSRQQNFNPRPATKALFREPCWMWKSRRKNFKKRVDLDTFSPLY